jgi:hypothetical protein
MNSINAALTGLKNIFGKAQVFVSNMTHEDYVELARKQGDKIQELSEIVRAQCEAMEENAQEYNRVLVDLEAEKLSNQLLAKKVEEDIHYQNRLNAKIQRAKEALG